MLEVKHLTAGYGDKQILSDVSFSLQAGISLMIGANGSGKSTLLKALFGLADITAGKVLFKGEDITYLPTANRLKKGLLYIPQKNNLFDDMTVAENLEIAGSTLSLSIRRQRTTLAYEIFPQLKSLSRLTPFKFSGGERQLLVLAMAMLHQPHLLMLDEPTTGLSEKNLEMVLENIKNLSDIAGVNVLVVEHRIKDAVQIADSMIELKNGGVFSQYRAALFTDERLQKVFT